MPEIRRKQGLRRWLSSPLFCIFLIIFSFILLKSLWGLYAKVEASAEARKESEEELDAVMDRKSFVEAEINRLKTPEGMEEEIRRKFSVAKPGEKVVVIVGEEEKPKIEEKQSFFQNVLRRAKSIFGE